MKTFGLHPLRGRPHPVRDGSTDPPYAWDRPSSLPRRDSDALEVQLHEYGGFNGLLEPGGTVITSLPSGRHISTLCSLLFAKRWPYRDRGIHDSTHLRFFAQRNLKDLFEGVGLNMKIAKRSLRLIETPHRLNRH